MTDAMRPLPFGTLLNWIVQELASRQSIFGIPSDAFFIPPENPPYASRLFGSFLATPVGPAAGPHTQMAQNIVAAWLCGGRFIELKTVQIMDELEIPRPCIDVADEGYNVEWSQELRLSDSVLEYVKAWALVHVLRRLLGFAPKTPFGTIFNMSVGYDLEGIQSGPMQRFMDTLRDASGPLNEIRNVLDRRFPGLADVVIPDRIVNSVTLSTMHGCPPDEIERIARYLLETHGLHTTIKLNPTLLGKATVLGILNQDLGFAEIEIPDSVFDHDLQYGRAVELIRSLQGIAADRGLTFGVKLSNTLAMANHRKVLPGDEMYMSGRALYPVTIELFRKLDREFGSDLNVSYSAGADALNLPGLLSAGALPVTVASDLLRPGGYMKLGQYLDNTAQHMKARGTRNLDELASHRVEALSRLASEALREPRYKKQYVCPDPPKVASPLTRFDCIAAPCIEACAVHQDVPEYAWWIAQGENDRALATILSRNPLPGITGYVCTHRCQTRCTRNHYDEPVAIRTLKRFAVEHGQVAIPPSNTSSGRRVAIIGSGPSGLAAAFYLALSGVAVTIFEAADRPGGMPAIAPEFRLPSSVVSEDVDRILALGVTLKLNHPVTEPPESLLDAGYDAVYVACGFAGDARLEIEGIDAEGVYGALSFLDCAAKRRAPDLGERVVIIGGGNTAMDAARTAQRLIKSPVTVLYRRTREEMPAELEELTDLVDEGNLLHELVSPVRILAEGGRVAGLECVRNTLGEPDADDRRRPVPVAGSNFVVPATSVILATGQQAATGFLKGGSTAVRKGGAVVVSEETGRASERPIFAGGDVTRGPAIIIEACADGRRAAEAICAEVGVAFRAMPPDLPALDKDDLKAIRRARARKEAPHRPPSLPPERRKGFEPVEQTLSPEAARAEAARCLQCTTLCDKCIDVCPNRANVSVLVDPVEVRLPVLTAVNGRLEQSGQEIVSIAQSRQIVHIDELCNECGNCSTFCVHPGDPYREKPRLFLGREAFDAESSNAFHLNEETLHQREDGLSSAVTAVADGFVYRDASVSIRFDRDYHVVEMSLVDPFEGTLSLQRALESIVLLRGIQSSAPQLIGASGHNTEKGDTNG